LWGVKNRALLVVIQQWFRRRRRRILWRRNLLLGKFIHCFHILRGCKTSVHWWPNLLLPKGTLWPPLSSPLLEHTTTHQPLFLSLPTCCSKLSSQTSEKKILHGNDLSQTQQQQQQQQLQLLPKSSHGTHKKKEAIFDHNFANKVGTAVRLSLHLLVSFLSLLLSKSNTKAFFFFFFFLNRFLLFRRELLSKINHQHLQATY